MALGEVAPALDDPVFYTGDPYPTFARMRREDPVHRFEPPGQRAPASPSRAWRPGLRGPNGAEGGFWALSRHADITHVSKHPELFCSGKGVLLTDLTRPVLSTDSIVYLDPPKHTKHRKLLSPSLTVRRVAELEERVRTLTIDLMDRIDPMGVTNAVEALAYPLPLLVIAELLGVPREDFALFKEWSDAIIESASEFTDEGLAKAAELFTYVTDIVEDRRRNPRDDLISVLLQGHVDGERLDPLEINMFCLTLLVAGNETTRTLVANGLLALAEHPAQRQVVVGDPAKVAGAVEELLRWEAPIMNFCRTATCDTEIRGVPISEGDYVVMFYGAANRDEEVFGPTADVLDVTRDPNPHLSFGYAEHYCMGAGLARLEARVLFGEVLARWPAFELAGPVTRTPSRFVRAIADLPVVFSV